jgi:ubiquinol-cytochrome c reductase cytochrome c subunit
MRRRLLALVALLCAAAALVLWATPGRPAHAAAAGAPPAGDLADPALAARGRELFASGCAYCHGIDARGVAGKGPTLRGVGAAAADFYLATGRMPLSEPSQEPRRGPPAYTPAERRALVAYVASLGGPGIPAVNPAAGDVRVGRERFADLCAGCHTIGGRGGVVPGAIAPALQQATAVQVAEAIRVGPHLMPLYPEAQVDQHELDSITRYVLSTRDPDDAGGWGLGNIGPVPEGMVAWLLAGTALLIVIRLVGERAETGP